MHGAEAGSHDVAQLCGLGVAVFRDGANDDVAVGDDTLAAIVLDEHGADITAAHVLCGPRHCLVAATDERLFGHDFVNRRCHVKPPNSAPRL